MPAEGTNSLVLSNFTVAQILVLYGQTMFNSNVNLIFHIWQQL